MTGFLRSIYRQVTSTKSGPQALTLKLALDAFQDNSFGAISDGNIVITHQGSGRVTTVRTPDILKQLDPESVMMLSEVFQQAYADALITLASAGNNGPADVDVFNCMLADYRFEAVTSEYISHVGGLWPYR